MLVRIIPVAMVLSAVSVYAIHMAKRITAWQRAQPVPPTPEEARAQRIADMEKDLGLG